MDDRQKALELKVGLFVFIGLAIIAVMVAYFGQIGQGFARFYPLTVEFPNSGGLIRNSDVQLAGARIGYVEEKPSILPGMTGVRVGLRIREGIKIPRATRFQVGSAGLLGDRYVEIIPTPDFNAAAFNPEDASQVYQPGEIIKGTEAAGLAQLQKKGEEVLDALKAELAELHKTTSALNSKVLTDENAKNVALAIENLRRTSENFAAASEQIKSMTARAESAVDSVTKAMSTAETTAADLKLVLADARRLMESAKGLVDRATAGRGLVAALLNDRDMHDNLRALLHNLRQRGILFYRDVSTPARAPESRVRH